LKPIPINPFLEIDPWRLLDAEPDPRSSRHPIIKVELGVRVLDAKDQAVAGHSIGRRQREQAALPRDIGSDPKGDEVGDVSSHIDVRAKNIEPISMDG
jgi:hypothetical protein